MSQSSSLAASRVERVLGHLSSNPVASSSSSSPVNIVARQNGVAVIQINSPPVNSWNPTVAAAIEQKWKDAIQDPSVKAIVITGDGKFFMAGADIEHMKNMQQKSSFSIDEIRDFVRSGNNILNAIESGSKPTVAAVNGTAFGGGCELAMACSARVALNGVAQFGLPELKLGIIPGLGGTQRLPRLIGVQKAVDATLSSKTIKAADAQKLGLVDVIVKSPNELIVAAGKLALDIASGKVPRRVSMLLKDKLQSLDMDLATVEMARVTAVKKTKGLPQVSGYCEAVAVGLKQGGQAGLNQEIENISKLVLGPVARSLMHFFFAERATSKVVGVPDKVPNARPIKRVAVIGGGTMGAGICIVYLVKGYEVILKEVNEKLLLAAVERIIEQLQRVIKARRLPTLAIEMMMRKLTPQTTWDGFDKVDLVVEAIIENVPIKQQLFVDLERVCPKHAILATNTSTIDIELIGQKTTAQDRIIGLHFFSPAHVMPLLEIVRTKLTSPETVSICVQMSKHVGKTPVVVGNCVAFVANRVFFPYGQAASLLVDAGLSPYRIDAALEKFGMPMGVFRMSDLSGIDIFIHVSEQINGAYGDRCYNSTMGKYFFNAKRLGQKTGAGYYKYAGPKHIQDTAIDSFLAKSRADAKQHNLPQLNDATISDQDIVEMLLFPIINESARTIVEGFAQSASDVDVCSVMGYGFPAYKGGVMFYGASTHQGNGLKRVVDRLQQFADRFGKDSPAVRNFFRPSNELKQLSAQ